MTQEIVLVRGLSGFWGYFQHTKVFSPKALELIHRQSWKNKHTEMGKREIQGVPGRPRGSSVEFPLINLQVAHNRDHMHAAENLKAG